MLIRVLLFIGLKLVEIVGFIFIPYFVGKYLVHLAGEKETKIATWGFGIAGILVVLVLLMLLFILVAINCHWVNYIIK